MIGAEELANIPSYQTLLADKIWKSYKPITKLILEAGAYYAPIRRGKSV